MINRECFGLRCLLAPAAFVYRAAVGVRNFCFDSGILQSEKFDLPVISVGNLAVGGTGKTPHTEYLVRLLKDVCPTATLSRGYGRKTCGFLLADKAASAKTIGDEPFQIKSKFGDELIVAVDERRRDGVERLQKQFPRLGALILDDAYQHRHVRPGLSILLTDYNRPFTKDCMLPVGNLREPAKNKNRADVLVVTKCPADLKPIDCLLMQKNLNLNASQEIYFTTCRYDEMMNPVYAKGGKPVPFEKSLRGASVLLVTGVANPEPLVKELKKYVAEIVHVRYADHYAFTSVDAAEMAEKFDAIASPDKIFVTTEKDAARLQTLSLPERVAKRAYSVGISVKFLQNKEEQFNKKILDYVKKNRRSR